MSFIQDDDDEIWVLVVVLTFVFAWVIAVLFLGGASPPFVVSATPNVISAGGSVRVACRVPRHPDNRRVSLGLDLYTTSTRMIEGDAAPTAFDLLISHVPCDPGHAFCLVEGVNGRSNLVRANLMVTC